MSRIVVSLTTIPSRLKHIEPTIKCLTKQSYTPNKIYLNIPYKTKTGKPYHIPTNFLSNIVRKDLITINRCNDYGPITKLLPTLDVETDPDTIIILVDDDEKIHRDVVKILVQKSQKYPNNALSFSGRSIGFFPLYLYNIFENKDDEKVDWIEGSSSILLKKKFIDKQELLNFDLLKIIPDLKNQDDHWISSYLETKHINRISINYSKYDYFTPFPISNLDAIHTSQGTLLGTLKFSYTVWNIATRLHNLGIYTHTHHIKYSVSFKIFVCIFILIKILF